MFIDYAKLSKSHIAVIYHPGTGGHFIGTLIHQLYYGIQQCNIGSTGDCHSNLTPGVPQFIPREAELSTITDEQLIHKFLESSVTLLRFPDKNHVFVNHPCFDQFEYINRLHNILPNTIFVSLDQDGGYLNEVRRIIMQAEKRTFSVDTPKEKTMSELQYMCMSDKLFRQTLNEYSPNNPDRLPVRYMIWKIIQSNPLSRVNTDNSDLITSDRIFRISMSAIFNNDSQSVIKSLEQVFRRAFTPAECEFVRTSLSQYCAKQNQTLLTDPILEVLNLRRSALQFMQSKNYTESANIRFLFAQQNPITDLIMNIIDNIKSCNPIQFEELSTWKSRNSRINLSNVVFDSDSDFISYINEHSQNTMLIYSNNFNMIEYCHLLFPQSPTLIMHPKKTINLIISQILGIQTFTPTMPEWSKIHDIISIFDHSSIPEQNDILSSKFNLNRIDEYIRIPVKSDELESTVSEQFDNYLSNHTVYIDPGWVINYDFDRLVNAISQAIQCDLSVLQIKYVTESVTTFNSKLDTRLLADPIDYFNRWCDSYSMLPRSIHRNDAGSFSVPELIDNFHIGVLFNMGTYGHLIQHLLACAESGIFIDLNDKLDPQSFLPQSRQFPEFLEQDTPIAAVSNEVILNEFNIRITEDEYIPRIYGFQPSVNANQLLRLMHNLLPNSMFLAITMPSYLDALRCSIIFIRNYFLCKTDSKNNNYSRYQEFTALSEQLHSHKLATRLLLYNSHSAVIPHEVEDYLCWILFNETYTWHINESATTVNPGVSEEHPRIVELSANAIFFDHTLVISKFEKILGHSLSPFTKEFILRNLNKIVSQTDIKIINDPVTYIKYLESNSKIVETKYQYLLKEK